MQKPATDRIVKRVAAALALCLGSLLASCTNFPAYVSDHWPHWAGGLPSDAPPRPGSPGYDDYMAHRQQSLNTDSANGSPRPAGVNAAPGATAQQPAVIDQRANVPPAQSVPPAPSGNRAPTDSAAVQGGLY